MFFKGREDTRRPHRHDQPFRRPSLRSASSKAGRGGETIHLASKSCPVLLAPRQCEVPEFPIAAGGAGDAKATKF